MRITVHVSEKIGKEVRRLAEDEKKSVSSVVARTAGHPNMKEAPQRLQPRPHLPLQPFRDLRFDVML